MNNVNNSDAIVVGSIHAAHNNVNNVCNGKEKIAYDIVNAVLKESATHDNINNIVRERAAYDDSNDLTREKATHNTDHNIVRGARVATKMESQVNLMNETPVDGCLVLGRDGPTYNLYNTRYYVNRKEQRHNMTQHVILDDCSPCCKFANQSAVVRAIWSVIRSEAFLLFLQVVVLAIGTTKECFDFRRLPGHLHFYQSVMEIFITSIQMSIRIFFTWFEFRDMKKHIIEVGYAEGDISVRGKSLHRYVMIFIVSGLAMILLNLILFGVFYTQANLGWTLLTNNVFMLMLATGASVLKARLTLIYFKVREDDHKVALLETTLLLRESFLLRSDEERRDYLDRVQRFLTAFKNTPYFNPPGHIHILTEYVPDWNLYKSSEQITVC